MAPSISSRPRIHVLLPKHRRWAWHERLLARLAQVGEVSASYQSSRPWPWALRLWLGPSGLGQADLARPDAAAQSAELVIDLSERPAPAGGPLVLRPLYDGSPDTLALVARLLHRQCPLLDIVEGSSGAIVASSYAAVENKTVLAAGLAQVFARVETLLLRAVEQRGLPLSPLPARPERPPLAFSRTLLARRGLRSIAGRLLRAVRKDGGRGGGDWNIALRRRDGPPDVSAFRLGDYTPLASDPSVYYADPFVLEEKGRHFLFAEAVPSATGKGEIVCAEVAPDGTVAPFETILERPFHLSYPCVVRHDGGIFLIPEASGNRALEVYRAQRFPTEWVLEARLFEGQALVDSTLFEHDGRLWLFAGMIGEGGSSWDELFAWHAPALAGPWTPHRLNPIKSDCRSARPGGRPIRIDGRLLRPAQRCERSYGESLVWLEIIKLTPDEFEEAEAAEWKAPHGVSGLHSADLGTGLEAVDFRGACLFIADAAR